MPRPHFNFIILRQPPINTQKPLIIINTHSALAAVPYVTHRHVRGDTSHVVPEDRFVSLETAGAGDPLVGEVVCDSAFGGFICFGVGFGVGAGEPVVAVVVGAAVADGEGPGGGEGLVDGVGEKGGGAGKGGGD